MKKAVLFLTLCGTAQLVLSCHHATEEVQPTPVPTPTAKQPAANYDALANATGHWQWERSVSLSGITDSAAVGYGRHLRFRSDSTLLLMRTNQADYSTAYHFTVKVSTVCGAVKVRFLDYSTNETYKLTTSASKYYRFDKNNGPLKLRINGEAACVDAHPYESYHWVPEP